MREYVITKEFNGKLEIEDLSIENVRCIYEDDYYSNRVMRGRFILYEDQMNNKLLNKPFNEFIFTDINGTTLKGQISGTSHRNEYNSYWQELKFETSEFSQWIRWGESEIKSVNLRYSIPYINDLSQDLQYSHYAYPEWIFKFGREPFRLILNNQEFTFTEHVYCYEYKEPDRILARELFIKVNLSYENIDKDSLLSIYESKIEDIMLIVSFIFNHRMRSYSYYAKFLDVSGKLVETIELKESNKLCGTDYLKKSNHKIKKFLNSDNLSKLIESFINKAPEDKKNITTLIHKFLTLGETEIFEPKFLSGYFLLEAVSKFIVKPEKNISRECLIKKGVEESKVESEKFKISHKREAKTSNKCEWEITEYRNFLTHFNYHDNYDGELMFQEYEKIVKMTREMLLWIICPDLSNWPLPNS